VSIVSISPSLGVKIAICFAFLKMAFFWH